MQPGECIPDTRIAALQIFYHPHISSVVDHKSVDQLNLALCPYAGAKHAWQTGYALRDTYGWHL